MLILKSDRYVTTKSITLKAANKQRVFKLEKHLLTQSGINTALNNKFSYRRDTALQGGPVLAKSERLID